MNLRPISSEDKEQCEECGRFKPKRGDGKIKMYLRKVHWLAGDGSTRVKDEWCPGGYPEKRVRA